MVRKNLTQSESKQKVSTQTKHNTKWKAIIYQGIESFSRNTKKKLPSPSKPGLKSLN